MDHARLPVLVLVGWTIFLWLSRLRNVLADDDLTTKGAVARSGVVVVFVALAGVVVVALRRGRPPLGVTVPALAGWTILFWLVRGTAIALDDHEASFIAVHVVLMAVSIGVALWALTAMRQVAVDDHADFPAR